MTWLFQWNWLGYLWTILIGVQLTLLMGMMVRQAVSTRDDPDSHQDSDKRIDMMTLGIVCTSFLLGLLTSFLWNFRTALWLLIGTCSLLAIIFTLGYGLMKLLGNPDNRI